jgi:hypothetical protein
MVFNPQNSFAAKDKYKLRLQQLLVWKISDKLNLDAEEEEKFSSMFSRLGQKRNKINSELQEVVEELSSAKSAGKSDKLLIKYEKKLKAYHAVQLEEIREAKKILGFKRAAKYISLKSKLLENLKSMFSKKTKNLKRNLVNLKLLKRSNSLHKSFEVSIHLSVKFFKFTEIIYICFIKKNTSIIELYFMKFAVFIAFELW